MNSLINDYISDYIAKNGNELMLKFLIFLFILIIICLIVREIVCWYFKINQLIALEKEANEDRKNIIKLLAGIYDSQNNPNNKEDQKQE